MTLPNHYFTVKDMLNYSGVNTDSLYQQIQSYLNESSTFTINHDGQEIDVLLQFPKKI